MGGRGKESQPTATGFTGYDYHKVYEEGDIHFIVQHRHADSGPSAPVMSQTSNVTYVTLGKNGRPKYISKYKKRIKVYQIDLDNAHHGLSPHVHHFDETGKRKENEPLDDMRLNGEQKRLYKKVMKIFEKHKDEIAGCVGGK